MVRTWRENRRGRSGYLRIVLWVESTAEHRAVSLRGGRPRWALRQVRLSGALGAIEICGSSAKVIHALHCLERFYFVSLPVRLFAAARSLLAAIAKITLHRRERTGIIRPYRNGLILHTIYYPNEIQTIPEYGKTDSVNLRKEEIALSEQFAKKLLKPFDPHEFRDEYQVRVRELLKTKQSGKVWSPTEKRKTPAPVIDLMSALKKSLAVERPPKSSNRSKLEPVRKRA